MIEPNKNKVGFWRRLAALWIDAFVIYTLTKVIIELISLSRFRISFGSVFIIIGAIYSSIMLACYKQTIGKMIMKIIITSKTDEPVNFRFILLREIFGKWGITIALPLMMGQLLYGNGWLPTVFDMLIMLPVITICIFYFLITKQMWYEHISGLTVKMDISSGKVKTGFYALIITAITGISTYLIEYKILDRIPCRMAAFQNITSTRPYVNFLKKQNTNPVDYVTGLFDKYDVVVLCERAHPEMTQWDFIYEVIRNPKFINEAGIVFTEYGQAGMQDYLNQFMAKDSLDKKEIHDKVIHIMRNMPVWPTWTNMNLYNYLTKLYHLNQTLPTDKRIQHYFTDAAVNWDTITSKEKYQEYDTHFLWKRDEIMAQTIIKEINKRSKSSLKTPKCLVVMNYRHAMDFTDRLENVERRNTYEFVKDAFGCRAANVLINSRILVSVPIAAGVWDDAFEETGNKPVGFNFQGSPFGNDFFDMFPIKMFFNPIIKSNDPVSNGSLRYRDVFTGFVFTNPVKEHYFNAYCPNYFDGFEKEYIRRVNCLEDVPDNESEEYIQNYNQRSLNPVDRGQDFIIETFVELFFYCFTGIGFIIGIVAHIFIRRKEIIKI